MNDPIWETLRVRIEEAKAAGAKGLLYHPMGFGAELFESPFCPAPMCQRTHLFFSQMQAQDHYKRVHQNPKHWAFIK